MNRPDHLKAVAFDLDGLIVNSEDLYEKVVDQMLDRRGKTHDRELRNQMMGRPLLESFQIMVEYHSLADLVEDLSVECRTLFSGLLDTSLATMPGFRELIAALRSARIPFGVATSSSFEYADDVLARLKLRDEFQFVLTADDVEQCKPSPDIYLLAAQRFEIRPEEMMVLEDSTNGCRAGVTAGAYAVAVPNEHTRLHDFSGARFIAETLGDARIRLALRI